MKRVVLVMVCCGVLCFGVNAGYFLVFLLLTLKYVIDVKRNMKSVGCVALCCGVNAGYFLVFFSSFSKIFILF